MQQIRQNLAHGGRGVLDFLHGSIFLVWYFRALGCSIGRDVCLYPRGADPMMTEPELVEIGDRCALDECNLVAHINTLGEFELNPLKLGAHTTMRSFSRLLSGAQTEEHVMLLEHTLVLAGDVVERGCTWQGWPSHSTWGPNEEIRQYASGIDDAGIEMQTHSQVFEATDFDESTEGDLLHRSRLGSEGTDDDGPNQALLTPNSSKPAHWTRNNLPGVGGHSEIAVSGVGVNAFSCGVVPHGVSRRIKVQKAVPQTAVLALPVIRKPPPNPCRHPAGYL